ncbi:MAG: hypothetical protein GY859_03245, partial [Desulfobacterales bacterium]|nr:hypothetical protein [Desulfobacterales bacterium]
FWFVQPGYIDLFAQSIEIIQSNTAGLHLKIKYNHEALETSLKDIKKSNSEIPVFSKFIYIPDGQRSVFTYSIIKSSEKRINPESAFKFKPSSVAELTPAGGYRGNNAASLTFYPYTIGNNASILNVVSEIEIDIKFIP